MLNLARWTSVLGSLGPVTVRNNAQRCVMQVLMMLYKLWTVLWRSTAVFVCPSTQSAPASFRNAPPPSLPVGSCPSVVQTGDEHRHPCIDVRCEKGIQIYICVLRPQWLPADLQICRRFVSSDLPGSDTTSELTQAHPVVVTTLLHVLPPIFFQAAQTCLLLPSSLVRRSSIWKKADRRVSFAGGPLPLQKEGRHWFLL